LELARWGTALLGAPRTEDYFGPGWVVLAMKARFRPDLARGIREPYEFRVGDEVFHARDADGTAETAPGPVEAPAFTLRTNPEAFLALAAGRLTPERAFAPGGARLDSDSAAFARFTRLFPRPAS
jgi:hypothetical protein